MSHEQKPSSDAPHSHEAVTESAITVTSTTESQLANKTNKTGSPGVRVISIFNKRS